MGVIVNQSIKGSVYSYIGAAVGFVNIALLFPVFFATDEIGLIFLLVSVAMLFAQVFGLGFTGVTIRLFPYFSNKEKGHNGFSFVMLATAVVGILLFVMSYYFIRPIIVEQNSHSLKFIENIDLIIPLVIIEIIFRLLNSYTSVLLNTVIGTFYKEFVLRLIILVLIVLFVMQIVDYQMFLYLYVAVQSVPVLALFIYLVSEGELSLKFQLSFFSVDLKKSIFFTALVSLVTGLSAMGYQYIDKYMINTMLDLSNTGVYTIAFFFGSMIGLPARSLIKIASVVIAKAWKENRLGEIKDIYVKSSLTQTVIGLFVLLGIMINIDDVISILGKDYIEGKMVIFFIGLSFLINLIFGVSAAIIGNSKQYRVLSYLMIVFLIIVVISNYYLIPIYGIEGAAIASAISILIHSIFKYLYILYKYKMQPFTAKHLIPILLSPFLFAAFYFMPDLFSNPFLNILIKSIVFSLVYIFLIYKLKVSVDINEKIEFVVAEIKTRFLK